MLQTRVLAKENLADMLAVLFLIKEQGKDEPGWMFRERVAKEFLCPRPETHLGKMKMDQPSQRAFALTALHNSVVRPALPYYVPLNDRQIRWTAKLTEANFMSRKS